MKYQKLLEAMAEGFEAAGFVNVSAKAFELPGINEVGLEVKGDCPCGLGTSHLRIANRVNDDIRALRPGLIREHARRMGLKHIEEDKKEGRWTA